MRIRFVSLLICLLLAIPAWALDAPLLLTDDLVWQLVKETNREEPFPDDDAVIVLDQLDTRFRETGASTTIEEVLVLIREEAAGTKYPSIHYDFNPRTGDIRVLEVKVYRSDGETVETVPLTTFRTLPAPADSMFWNFTRRIAPVPALRKGDALYYRIQRKGLNLAYLLTGDGDRDYLPPQPDHFFDSVFFEDHLPLVRKTYTLWAPRTKPVQYRVVNGDLNPRVEFIPDYFKYVWERKNVPAFQPEPYGADYDEAACKLVMATLEDWQAKSRWAYEVNEPQFVIDDAIRAGVAELTAGADSDYERMFRLLHWVADEIRYLGIDMGEGEGYTVHRTDDIFRDRVGVCKDKAAVLVSMLRAAGFETYFILTLAMQKAVDVPADQFNHGVVGVRNADGTWTFLDPTWAPNNRPLFNHQEQQQPILIATPDGEDLTEIPFSPPEENPWILTAKTTLAAAGPTRIVIESRGDGMPDGRMRAHIFYRYGRERYNYFSMIADSISPFARVLDAGYGDIYDYDTPMQWHTTLEVDDYALAADDRLWFIPPLSHQILRRRYDNDYLLAAEPEKRSHDLTLDSTRSVEYTETIRLPKGYRLPEPPARIELDGPAAALTYEVIASGRTITVKQQVKIKKRWIPPAEYTQFREVIEAVDRIRETRLLAIKGGAK